MSIYTKASEIMANDLDLFGFSIADPPKDEPSTYGTPTFHGSVSSVFEGVLSAFIFKGTVITLDRYAAPGLAMAPWGPVFLYL